MIILLNGLIIGLSIAAPVGPIGLLCIRRTLNQGRLHGFISGAGAATADAVYGTVAACGLTIVSQFLMNQKQSVQLVGGLFLIYLGIQSMRSHPNDRSARAAYSENLAAAYLSTFILTLTNPMTILSFVGVFAGLGISNSSNTSAVLLVLGVFIGSLLWWLLLSFGVEMISRFMKNGWLVWINRGSGAVLVLFGLHAIYDLWK